MMSETVFQTEALSFAYRRAFPILTDVSFSIEQGDFVALIGPNGAGKSTLLHLLTGWLRPTNGSIRFRARDLARWPRKEFARLTSYVPQSEEGIFPFSVEETVLMGRYAFQSGPIGFDDDEDRRIAQSALEMVGLAGFGSQSMPELSGGERQRVLIARALAQCPSTLLLDEPTASLDLAHQREIMDLLKRLNKDFGLTILAVTHEMNLAARYCRRILVLHDHQIAFDGMPEEVFQQDILSHIYNTPIEILRTSTGNPVVALGQ